MPEKAVYFAFKRISPSFRGPKQKGLGTAARRLKPRKMHRYFNWRSCFFLSAGLVFLSAGLVFLSAGLENQLAELMKGTGDAKTAALRRPREGNSAI